MNFAWLVYVFRHIQMSEPLILITEGVDFVYHMWEFTLIHWQLSYPFRSLNIKIPMEFHLKAAKLPLALGRQVKPNLFEGYPTLTIMHYTLTILTRPNLFKGCFKWSAILR